jgi:hypothetical protein
MNTSQEHKSFIEKIKACLREKKEKDRKVAPGGNASSSSLNPVVTLEEIFKGMSTDEKLLYYQFQSQAYLNTTFNEAIKNNPKIHFDLGRKSFSFKNQYYNENDLLEKLYQNRNGVIEDQNLYDDIDKTNLEKLKRENLLREIIIKDKKSKPAITILFSKNHSNDEVEKLSLEMRTPDILKDYWEKINKEELERMDLNKRSATAYLNRGQPDRALKKTEKRKTRRNREEDNPREWRNYHLAAKIEDALKMINKRAPETKKLPRKLGNA